ncbi:hypothetical protein APA_704 [Pseudanabaena sp. lw0831]|uniref:hypothetical protein n=1 Tax=Pseudanabaena sp. lw0831 TaxID=1357935 RepID=UPI00191695AD|nr:hypothetical protein [Pseudanabaena sp. lw0831]GBO52903.1 hypothetical protein APA_704 [Pseudanabaena sp. lw0831]
MTEEPKIKAQEIKLSFPYIKNNLPSFTNAVLVNMVSKEAFILDFGFFDPLSVQGSVNLDSLPDSTCEVESVSRLLLTREVAENLLKQLESILNGSIVKD